jgi:phytoene dehydrogenase-like protein
MTGRGQTSWDAIVVGGGHNGLVAATLLARAGRTVLVLERRDQVGGAAVSASPFPGHEVRLSRYSYLVSLFPRWLLEELGVDVELRRRRVPAYTAPPPSPGADREALEAFYAMTTRVAQRVFPTLTEPLPSRDELCRRVDDDAAWEALFEQPLSEVLTTRFSSDEVRGTVATDGLIGTFADLTDPGRLANRCFLYHVIGNGTGRWDVPVGGMGALTRGLADAARRAGAELRTSTTVTGIAPDETTLEITTAAGDQYTARHLLAGLAPTVLVELLGDPPGDAAAPEGAQLKLNLLLSRLPRLREAGTSAEQAFTGTFHVNEGYNQLQLAHRQAADGQIPALPPCEAYCHSLTDPSILGPELRAAGAQTLTVFGLHMPARLFGGPGHDAAKTQAIQATLQSLNSVLAEPIEDCLLRTASGEPCLEARTPVELEAELGLPGGHIFHRELSWPYAEHESELGRWGVETTRPNVWLCGAGARRGGGVSGIPGHNAARAVLAAGR